CTVEQICDGLESAMGVPGCAFGFTGRVFDRAHVVEQQKGIGAAQVEAGERSADPKTLAFELGLGRDDLGHGPVVSDDRIRSLNTWENENVVSCCGGHSASVCRQPCASADYSATCTGGVGPRPLTRRRTGTIR